MTTLGDLQSRIADDLARADLTNQISAAITDAITHFATTRFYFNEVAPLQASSPVNGVSTQVIMTKAGQYLYTGADLAAIPAFLELDDLFVTINQSRAIPLRRDDADLLLELISTVVTQGYPFSWAWMGQGILLYPIPNNVYPVSLTGAIKIAPPTDPSDATNPWITEAFELVRCYAKGLLYAHVIRDPASAALMLGGDGDGGLAGMARAKLERETSSKWATGRVRPTEF